jgi:TonB-dependent SusC/RagA subfamily outer membrane receptor
MRCESRRGAPYSAAIAALLLAAASACHRPAKQAPVPDSDAEPVNVGYGTQSRSRSNVSVGTIDTDDLNGQAVTTWEQLIVGRVPGLEVVRSESGMTLRIRGASTINAGSDPLIIVDGVQLSGTTNLLLSVNPQDVRRIEVLKDAGATAIYGSRGANGVVLVTLKKHRN